MSWVGTVAPEGVVIAPEGRIYLQIGGNAWQKGPGVDATGWVDIGPWADGGGGGGATYGEIVRLTDSGGQNLNASASGNVVEWDQVDSIEAPFSYDPGEPTRLEITEDGTYLVSVHISYFTTSARYNGQLCLRRSGVELYTYRGKSGYVRNATGHTEASLDLPMVPLALSAGDYLEALIDRESNASGTVTMSVGQSLFSAVRVA